MRIFMQSQEKGGGSRIESLEKDEWAPRRWKRVQDICRKTSRYHARKRTKKNGV